MYLQDIDFLINIQELNITNVEQTEENILLHAEPTDSIQPCPCWKSKKITRQGVVYRRKVRHLAVFEKTTFLNLPAILMKCKECSAYFVCEYACVAPKKPYTKAFEKSVAKAYSRFNN